MTNRVLNNLSNKLKSRIKRSRLKIVYFVWNILVFIAAANRNNPLLNYLPQKHADIWLEQATQIKASMGVSREKNDKIDSQKIGLYAYKNREDVKLWTPKRPVIVQLDGVAQTV